MRWSRKSLTAFAVVVALVAVATGSLVARSGAGEKDAAELVKQLVITGDEALPASSSAPSVATTVAAIVPDTSPSTVAAPPVTEPTTVPVTGVIVTGRGRPLPATGRVGDQWQVVTPCGATATVGGRSVGAVDVVIDPGHGGSESGAVGANGLREKDLNFAVAVIAANVLNKAGVRVLLTRTEDYRSTLASRGLVTMAANPKAFVSIHHNAGYQEPSARPGSEVYHQVGQTESRRLGGLIYDEITRTLSAYPGIPWVAARDPGVKTRTTSEGQDYYGVVRRTRGTPGVLAELAFIGNPPEAELLARGDVQRAEGEAVARAVLRFLRSGEQGGGYVDQPAPRVEPAGPGGGAEGCVDPPL